MNKEIERKFLIKDMPNLHGLASILYERYFLFKSRNIEIRIQKKGEFYEFERKEIIDNLTANKQKFNISKEEFESFKKQSQEKIIRESYITDEYPKLSIKVYHDKFEGLIRAEIEFSNEKEAKEFKPYPWLGKEITDTALGRDSKLLGLDKSEFNLILKEYNT